MTDAGFSLFPQGTLPMGKSPVADEGTALLLRRRYLEALKAAHEKNEPRLAIA